VAWALRVQCGVGLEDLVWNGPSLTGVVWCKT
jgi:hypothetical protein